MHILLHRVFPGVIQVITCNGMGPVSGETFDELSGPLVHTDFP